MHPKYETKYRVGNWAEYDRALVRRGDVTLWLTPDAIATWAAAGVGRRSGQLQYSDLAIETTLTLSLIFHLPLRQTEGFLTSIFGMLGVDLTAPDHTTLSRRGQHLALALRRACPGTSRHLIVDSTGLSIVGEGAWAAATHGGRGRRGWRKLHLGVDGSRVIVACALTEPTADDAITGISLVDEVDGHLTRVTADPAYDTLAFYGAAGARGARVVVPPTKTASLSRRGARSGARDRTIRRSRPARLEEAPSRRRPVAHLLALLANRHTGLRVALAAPTGKAAARLGEAIGQTAQTLDGLLAPVRSQLERAAGQSRTLHRLLGWNPRTDRCRFHAGNPLPADVVVVDEASMLDLALWDRLLAAVTTGSPTGSPNCVMITCSVSLTV